MLTAAAAKETSIEFHFPGQEFTGPGTHVITKILNKVMPRNKTDFVTMLHDIDYLRNAGLVTGASLADYVAIYNADYSLPGIATKLGLTIRNAFGFNFNKNIDGYTDEQTRKIGVMLMHYVMNTYPYAGLFAIYGVRMSDYY